MKARVAGRSAVIIFCGVAVLPLAHVGMAAEPWRIEDAIARPDWLAVSGTYRLRYERLDNTFRTIDPDIDDIFVSRLQLAAEARAAEWLRFGAELQDSRAWGAEAGTPLGSDDVNALEALQYYVGIRGDRWLPDGDTLDLRLGRFVMAMGSNRFVARHAFRNTRQGFTGANVIWSRTDGPRLQAFVTHPVLRLPFDRAGLDDNDIEFDEDLETVFWGAHLDRIDLGYAEAQAYVFGIDDSDTAERPTRNRNFVTAGFRLMDDAGPWYWEIESAFQFGSIRETPLPSDTTNLDQRAWLLHLGAGWRIDGPWDPNLELRYDYASGDQRPGDGDHQRFDSLFGPVRFDFGPTGLYSAVRRSNTNTPGIYLTLKPQSDLTWMTGYRAVWLASDRDRFGNTLVRDPDGGSGNFAGHQVETRLRWEILPGNLRFEAGGAVLFKDEFLEDAPLTPDTGDTIYLYSQLLTTF